MRLEAIAPPPDLAPWVASGMSIRIGADEGASPRNRFPAMVTGMLGIMLAGESALASAGADAVSATPARLLPAAFLSGIFGQPLVSVRRGALHCVGLTLWPATLPLLLRDVGGGLRDAVVDARDALGAEWDACRCAVADAPDDDQRVRHLFAFVRARLHARRVDVQRHERMQRLAFAGMSGLRAGAAQAGLGERQFERQVVLHWGIGPKRLQRIARVNRLLGEIRHRRLPAAQLAVEGGYSDQAHMARELRALTGVGFTEMRRSLQQPSGEQWPTWLGTTPAGRGAAPASPPVP